MDEQCSIVRGRLVLSKALIHRLLHTCSSELVVCLIVRTRQVRLSIVTTMRFCLHAKDDEHVIYALVLLASCVSAEVSLVR
jgi:hypothetical protein